MSISPKLLYGVDEGAEMLSLSTKEVRRMIVRGDLMAVRVGRRVLLPAGALAAYTARLEAEARRRAAG